MYDDDGSAHFETFCRLPWYTITRAEMRLLAAHADYVFRHLESLRTIVELGPGSGEKLRTLLEGASSRRRAIDVHLVDVSESALELAEQTIGTFNGVHI